MDNALYRQGMNRNMQYPVQRGGANNYVQRVGGVNSGLTPFTDNYRDTYLADPSETTKPDTDYVAPTWGSYPMSKLSEAAVKGSSAIYEKVRNLIAKKLFEEEKDRLSLGSLKDAKDAVDEYADSKSGYQNKGKNFDGDLRDKQEPGKFAGDLRGYLGLEALDKDKEFRNGVVTKITDSVKAISDYLKNKRDSELNNTDEWVEITLEPGKSFGQAILDNGLATDHGLWGSDGDVAYYEKQLRDSGAIDNANNVGAGQSFRIKKRK